MNTQDLDLVTDCLVAESPEYSTVDSIDIGLVGESAKKNHGKSVIIRGPYGESDFTTANRRNYPHEEFVPAVDRIQPALKKCLYGEYEHPTTHIIEPKNAILKHRKLWMDGKVLMGESVPAATHLGDWYTRIILEDGYVLPMSIRALCKMVKRKGVNYCRNLKLLTVDAVKVNAASIAVPGVVYESALELAESGLIGPEEANRIELFESRVDPETAKRARQRSFAALIGGLHAFGELY